MASDVKEARIRLNFSEIGSQPAARQKAVLFEAVNQIQLGAMPLASYLRIHPKTAMTAKQLAILRAYLSPPAPATAAAEADVAAAGTQYGKWVAATNGPPQVRDEPNSVAFLPDYKNWRAISSTDRFDNGTMRVILGNDISDQSHRRESHQPLAGRHDLCEGDVVSAAGRNGLCAHGGHSNRSS